MILLILLPPSCYYYHFNTTLTINAKIINQHLGSQNTKDPAVGPTSHASHEATLSLTASLASLHFLLNPLEGKNSYNKIIIKKQH